MTDLAGVLHPKTDEQYERLLRIRIEELKKQGFVITGVLDAGEEYRTVYGDLRFKTTLTVSMLLTNKKGAGNAMGEKRETETCLLCGIVYKDDHSPVQGRPLQDRPLRHSKLERQEMVRDCASSGDAYHCDPLLIELENYENQLVELRKRMSRQFPKGMEHCTIVHKQCKEGHSWLTAENWVQHDCLFCEIAKLRKLLDWHVNHCDKNGGECQECGVMHCPKKDPLHFHHDGCPSCCIVRNDEKVGIKSGSLVRLKASMHGISDYVGSKMTVHDIYCVNGSFFVGIKSASGNPYLEYAIECIEPWDELQRWDNQTKQYKSIEEYL